VLEQLLDELVVDVVEETGPPPPDPGLQQKVRDLAKELRSPDVRRRWRAAVALWEIGPAAADAVEALTVALSDEAPIVANAATQALARIRGESEPKHDSRPTTGAVDVPVLVEALQHHDVRVREWAAVALRDLGTAAQDAVPALIAVLKDPASGIRDWAALALGAVSTDVAEVLPELVRALGDSSMFLRAAAATSLGSLGARAKPAVPDLMNALRDENGGVRGRAAVALGRMGPVARDAVPLLLRLLEDREVSVADAASLALEKIIGRPEPTAAFAAVRDRAAAAATPPPPDVPPQDAPTPPEPEAPPAEPVSLPDSFLAAVLESDRPAPGPALPNGAPPRVRDLIKGLGDDDGNVRWRAAVALGQMGAVAVAAVRPLIEIMDDDTEESVRWEAAKALGRIGPAAREAVPALAAALAEGDEVLRDAAATALGLMGPAAQNAVPALIRSLRGAVDGERDAALETLVKLGRSSVPALIEALNEDDPVIRSRAAAALTRVASAS
jgi:HEAT repeat protein